MPAIGGEEFVILLPETGVEEAGRVAERIRRSVERAPQDVFAGTIISAGVSGVAPAMNDLDDLLRAADEALYSAKQAGRNRVVTNLSQAPPGQG